MTELHAFLVFLAYQVAAFLLSLLLGKRSQIDAWAERRYYLAAVLKVLRASSLDPWLLIQGLSLAVHRKLPKGMGAPPPMLYGTHDGTVDVSSNVEAWEDRYAELVRPLARPPPPPPRAT